jgi:hypothetical protein
MNYNIKNLLGDLQVDNHDQHKFLCHQANYHTFYECYDTFFQHYRQGNHSERFLYLAIRIYN